MQWLTPLSLGRGPFLASHAASNQCGEAATQARALAARATLWRCVEGSPPAWVPLLIPRWWPGSPSRAQLPQRAAAAGTLLPCFCLLRILPVSLLAAIIILHFTPELAAVFRCFDSWLAYSYGHMQVRFGGFYSCTRFNSSAATAAGLGVC
eukprot:COSAG01_NODE_1623_length_9708_cov_32.044438_18_plen_151_part_00